MFPGTSDTSFTQNWTMATSGILPNDVRFLESAGKFTLQPGAVNFITTGVVWARATSGGPLASVDLLKSADSTVQLLFNSCFTIGLNESVKEITYSIFPNPCHSTSILKFYSAEVKNATLKIYDVTGKVVRELKVLSTNEIVIDKKGLVDGLYIFKLVGDNKAKASGKLMIL